MPAGAKQPVVVVQAHWNSSYANRIVEGQSFPLVGQLAAYVDGFDFSIFLLLSDAGNRRGPPYDSALGRTIR
jgi:hypothetical protein